MRLVPLLIVVCLAGCANRQSRTWNDTPAVDPGPHGPATIVRVPAPQQRFENGGITETGGAEWRVYSAGQQPKRTVGPQIRREPKPAPTADAGTAPAAQQVELAAATPPAPAGSPVIGSLAVPTPELLSPVPASAPAPAVMSRPPAPVASASVPDVEAPATRVPATVRPADTAWPGQQQGVATVTRDAASHGWAKQQQQSLGRKPRVYLGACADHSGSRISAVGFVGQVATALASAGQIELVSAQVGADLVLAGTTGIDRDFVQIDLRVTSLAGEVVWPYAVELPRRASNVDPILGGSKL